MMTSAPGDSDQNRIDAQAYDWAAEMADTPTAARRAQFEAWLAQDRRHRETYQRVAQAITDAAILQHSRLPRMGNVPAYMRWQRPLLAASLAVGLLVMAYVAFAQPVPPDGATIASGDPTAPGPDALGPPDTFSNPVGPTKQVRLADGSLVILDTDSAVIVRFTKAERLVTLLRGRARFSVAHAPHRAFLVLAAGGQVRAVGTMFDVALTPDQGAEVQLIEGAVDVTFASSPAQASLRPPVRKRLLSGQGIGYGHGHMKPATQHLGETQSWASGILEFDNMALSDVIERANSYSARKISVADPSLGHERFTGAVRLQGADHVARALANATGLRSMPSDSGPVLTRQP